MDRYWLPDRWGSIRILVLKMCCGCCVYRAVLLPNLLLVFSLLLQAFALAIWYWKYRAATAFIEQCCFKICYHLACGLSSKGASSQLLVILRMCSSCCVYRAVLLPNLLSAGSCGGRRRRLLSTIVETGSVVGCWLCSVGEGVNVYTRCASCDKQADR